MSAIRIFAVAMVLTAVTFATAQAATMDEIKEATDALIEFIEKGDYKKAQGKVDFLSAALNEFDFDVKKKFFKDDLAGFIGGEMSAQSVMGISVIERTYTRGGKTVKVSLTDLVASAGPAGLAAMDQMFGQQQATFRLPGRVAASVTNQGGLTEITATIGRSIFRVESSNTKEEKVKEVANAFPIKELLDYVEGR